MPSAVDDGWNMVRDRSQAERAIHDFLVALGLDPAKNPELRQTPERVTEAFADEFLSGYEVDVVALLAHGTPVERGPAEPVLMRRIAMATVCPHHLTPALGFADVAYEPGRHFLGLGALARLLDAYSRRLALQEEIGENVVNALMEHAEARGAYCRIELRHACLCARGSRKAEATVVTRAARGTLRDASALNALLHGAPPEESGV